MLPVVMAGIIDAYAQWNRRTGMSTNYYRTEPPITSICPEERGGHTHVGIWVNHAKSGTLVFRNEEWENAVALFFNYDRVVLRRTSSARGIAVNECVDNLLDEQQVISEYGDLVTVGGVRAEANHA